MEKLRVLVLGGTGFIGRNFVSYLVTNDLVSIVRVVDKVPPQVAWLNHHHQTCFNNAIVDFKSANLINLDSCKKVFVLEDGNCWDLVVNCAGETKSGQTDPVYNEGILKLSLNCAREAAAQRAKHYVELSSGNMFSSEKISHKEDGNVEPWTFVAKWKRRVEQELSNIENLRYTVLRLPIVYGLSDRTCLMPRIMGAAIYKQLGKTMKLLWDSDLKINTVHVNDVCRAITFINNRDDTIGQIYNIVDEANSSQGSISQILTDLFEVKVDYYGSILSSVVDLVGAADTANDKHLLTWAEACRKDDIQNTPLSPYIDVELLQHKHLHLDGTKLKNLGFKLNVPQPTGDKFKEILDDYIQMNIFPHSLAP